MIKKLETTISSKLGETMVESRARIFIIVTTGLFLVACAVLVGWQLMNMQKSPLVGLNLSSGRSPGKQVYVLKLMDSGPAAQAGIQEYDSVLSINDIPILNKEQLRELAEHLQVGDVLNYRVQRGDQKLVIPVRAGAALSLRNVLPRGLISTLMGLIYLVVGFFVFWKRPADRRARIFYFFTLASAAVFMSSVLQAKFAEDALGVVEHLTETMRVLKWQILTALTLSLFLHLALIFPKDRPFVRNNPRFFFVIYSLPLYFVLISTCFTFISLDSPASILHLLLFLAMPSQVIYIVAILVSLRKSYRESNAEERRQIKWPLWGMYICVAGQILFLLTRLLLAMIFTDSHLAQTLFDMVFSTGIFILSLLIPTSFAIAIFKYRLMDIDLIIKKTVGYTVLSVIIIGLYFGIVAGLSHVLVEKMSLGKEWLTIGATLAMAGIFVPVRNRVQKYVHHRFYQREHDHPVLLRCLRKDLREGGNWNKQLEIIIDCLQRGLDCRAVAVLTRSSPYQPFRVAAKVGLPDEIIGTFALEPSTELASIFTHSWATLPTDLPESTRRSLQQIRGAHLVGVHVGNDPMAIISLGDKLGHESYDAVDQEFVSEVAQQLALVFAESKSVEQATDSEQAREIQKALLPSALPQFPDIELFGTWRPTKAVGGDYYDAVRLEENFLGLCIADVVGKGVPAALLMSNLQAIFRTSASHRLPPRQLCEKINRLLHSQISRGKFITFFYAMMHTETRQLLFTNAGHNPPLLIRSDSSIIKLHEGGPVLGILADADFHQGEVLLQPGDRLVLYTDGVTDVWNEAEELFGEERLIQIIRQNRELDTESITQRILDSVTDFSHGELEDDVTLLVAAVK